MNTSIKILNTNLSNLQSIKYAVERLGYQVENVDNIKQFESEEIVIIPGVGHYSQAMKNLQPKFANFKEIANEKNLKVLGICLGMQLLFSFSEEGNKNGLNILPGKVQRLDKIGIKTIPNIGWRQVSFTNSELKQFSNQYFYFVHSYAAVPDEKKHILGTTTVQGKDVTVLVSEKFNDFGRYIGCQFHPEKSGEEGLKFLNFILKKLEKG